MMEKIRPLKRAVCDRKQSTGEEKVSRKYTRVSSRMQMVWEREGVVRANEEGPRARRAEVRV